MTVAAALMLAVLQPISTAPPTPALPPTPAAPPTAADDDGRFELSLSAPTGRELYVSCSLHLGGDQLLPKSRSGPARLRVSPKSPVACLVMMTEPIGHRNNPVPASAREVYCLPERPDLIDAVAQAYVDYFERHAAEVANLPGRRAMHQALFDRWPCPTFNSRP